MVLSVVRVGFCAADIQKEEEDINLKHPADAHFSHIGGVVCVRSLCDLGL